MCQRIISQHVWEIKRRVPDTFGTHYLDLGNQGSEGSWRKPNPVSTGPQSISPAECTESLEHEAWYPLLPVKVGWGMLPHFPFQSPDD